MKTINDFKFENVWSSKSEALTNELISFWSKNNVLDDGLRKHRANQVAFTIRAAKNEIVGVSTVAKIFHKPLQNYVYLYRCFIAETSRTAGLDTVLTSKTKDYLESIYTKEKPTAVGFLIVAQSDFLKQWNKAVWPGINMTFIGNTDTGDPIRIYYFKGARI